MARKIDHDELLESLGLIPSSKTRSDFNSAKNRSTAIEQKSSEVNFSHRDINSCSGALESPRKKLFSMTIDLPDMSSDVISVFENDDPIMVARLFSKKHHLNEKFFNIIADTLIKNVNSFEYNQPNESNLEKPLERIEKSNTAPAKEFFTLGDTKEEDPPSPSSRASGAYTDFQSPLKSSINNLANTIDQNERPSNITQSSENFGTRSIFDRLHDDAKLKSQRLKELTDENSTMETKKGYKKSSQIVTQRCLELYSNALRKQQKFQKLNEESMVEKEYEYNENCTFKPQINPRSEKLAAKSKLNDRIERLIEFGKKIDEEHDKIKHDNMILEMNKYTFRPQINELSNKMITDRKGSIIRDVFEDLYNQYRIINEKKIADKVKYAEEYPFAPVTNTYLPKWNNLPFLERVKQFLEGKKIKGIIANENDAQKQDLTFQPHINRGPKFSRNAEKLPIGDYLYKNKFEIDFHKQELVEKAKLELEEKAARCSEKSAEIIENKKKKRYEEIFNYMDSDGDGLISPHKIELNNLSTEILEAFAPLLIEMDQLNAELDFDSFHEAADRLVKGLDPAIKEKIFYNPQPKYKNDPKNNEDLTFKPNLNKKSLIIAEEKRLNFQGDTYDRLKAKQEYSKMKIKQLQEEKDEEQMKECSFHPNINKANR